MNYAEALEKAFWDNLNFDDFDHQELVQVMSMEDNELEQEILSRPTLRTLLGIPLEEKINVVEEEEVVSSNETSSDDSEGDESFVENIRMDKKLEPDDLSDLKGKGKKEEGESSKKRKANDGTSNGNPNDFFSKFNTFDTPGTSKSNTLGFQNLDLNCISNDQKRKRIDQWAGDIGLLLKTNPTTYSDGATLLALAEHKAVGIAKDMIKKVRWTDENPEPLLNSIIRALYAFFLGKDYSKNLQEESAKVISDAKRRMTNMQLCNICNLEEFTCAYEELIWKIPTENHPEYIRMYLQKIPIFGEKALATYEKDENSLLKYSLHFATNIVKEELKQLCELNKKSRKAAKFSKKCCDIVKEEKLEFGCKTKKSKKKYSKEYKASKRYTRKKKRRFQFTKGKKKFQPKKVFAKSKDKAKFCPQGKKSCRCWICNTEGHYANECPDKQTSQKAKILEEILELGFFPIEAPFEGSQTVYTLEIHESSESETDSIDDSIESSSDESSDESD